MTVDWFRGAEREGFEPPVQLPVHRISSAARSTTPASFLKVAAKVMLFHGFANIFLLHFPDITRK